MTFSSKQIWIGFVLVIFVGLGVAVGVSEYSAQRLSCNTLTFNIRGSLVTSIATGQIADSSVSQYVTYSDVITKDLDDADKSKTIKAIIVDIDSYGGLPVAGEEIGNALRRSHKETVALIRSAGLSSAYWAASGAKHVIASANSDVGSIGVLMQLQNQVAKNKREGISITSITSGQFKDMGDPNRDLTPQEKQLLQTDVNKIRDNFVNAISKNRNLSEEKVVALADGSSMLGKKALENGLIDEIGDDTQARNYLAGKIGTDVRICSLLPVQAQTK